MISPFRSGRLAEEVRDLDIKNLGGLVKHPPNNPETAAEEGGGLLILREIKREVIQYLEMIVVV